MSALESLMTSHPLPTWRPLAWPVMVLLTLMLVWSNFAELDEVAVVTGEVVPQGKVKRVQHLEGGIIKVIHVIEGDTVEAGAPLVELNLATGGVNRRELEVRLDGQLLARGRLEAEAAGTKPVFPKAAAKRLPDQLQAQRHAFEARHRELQSTLGVLGSRVKQRKLEIQEMAAKRTAVGRNLDLAKERMKMSQSLLADGLTPKMEHLQLVAEVESLEGEMRSLEPAMPRVRAAAAEAAGRVREEEQRFRRRAQEELGKTEQAISRIRELLAEATEQGGRTVIKSPIGGVVKNMRFNTIGGVVSPGEPIMEIVPTGADVVIEARLSPIDRGYVTPGQRTVVKISTYDFVRYGGLEGTVIMVAPDSNTDEAGNPYFRVVVRTDKTYLGKEKGSLPITPGMQATIDIHTGSKSVLDYLITPVLKLRHEAFRER